jgi:Ca2+-binding EF-hand superfamily protein
MQSTFLLLFAAALFGGSMAIAQSTTEKVVESKPPKYLAKFDQQFRTADKDGDGALTRGEAESAHMSRIVENFDRLDANRDGKVTRDEIRALLRSRLSS